MARLEVPGDFSALLHRKTMGKPWENDGLMGFNGILLVVFHGILLIRPTLWCHQLHGVLEAMDHR